MELLWTNPYPSNDFAAGSVQLPDLSPYLFLYVFFSSHKSYDNASIMLIVFKGSDNNEAVCYNAVKFHFRFSIGCSGNTLSFGDCHTYNNYGNAGGTEDNSYLIPRYVYGFRP